MVAIDISILHVVNTEVYKNFTSVVHLKYTGNARAMPVKYSENTLKIHQKYTDYPLTIPGMNVLLHIHFFYTKYTISSSKYTKYTKIAPCVVRVQVG